MKRCTEYYKAENHKEYGKAECILRAFTLENQGRKDKMLYFQDLLGEVSKMMGAKAVEEVKEEVSSSEEGDDDTEEEDGEIETEEEEEDEEEGMVADGEEGGEEEDEGMMDAGSDISDIVQVDGPADVSGQVSKLMEAFKVKLRDKIGSSFCNNCFDDICTVHGQKAPTLRAVLQHGVAADLAAESVYKEKFELEKRCEVKVNDLMDDLNKERDERRRERLEGDDLRDDIEVMRKQLEKLEGELIEGKLREADLEQQVSK